MKKLLLFGTLVLLLVAIPLTVYVSQQQQQTQSNAQKSTRLCFSATAGSTACATGPIAKKAGEAFDLDVILDPGTNQVSTVRLNITYDPTRIATTGAAITPNAQAVSPLINPTYANGSLIARYGIVLLSVGEEKLVDASKTLSATTKIATVHFKALDTAPAGNAVINFGTTLVLSSNPQDGQDEDVLSSADQLTITVSGASAPATAKAPVCTTLNVDRAITGAAPYSLTFTVNGTDEDGTISSATYDFGDGPVQTISTGGGLGTKTVSLSTAHTYNNAGTFKASATLTDNTGTVSTASATCTQTITVTPKSAATVPGGGSSGGSGTTVVATPTAVVVIPTSVNTPIPLITIAPPGPSAGVLGVGIVGAVVAVFGGLLLFSF